MFFLYDLFTSTGSWVPLIRYSPCCKNKCWYLNLNPWYASLVCWIIFFQIIIVFSFPHHNVELSIADITEYKSKIFVRTRVISVPSTFILHWAIWLGSFGMRNTRITTVKPLLETTLDNLFTPSNYFVLVSKFSLCCSLIMIPIFFVPKTVIIIKVILYIVTERQPSSHKMESISYIY